DGVMEARDPTRTFYPLEERVAHCAKNSPTALVYHVQQDLLAHAHGALCDDAALLAIQRSPTAPLGGLHLGDLVHGVGRQVRTHEEHQQTV
ncbi:SpoIIE family protein phosphatase, partial [Streptomyces shenzhenensis]